ncbi:MAG TPA: HNH endonuclease [Erysipelothrix sp.]
MSRKPISKKVRFEIFKRDQFKCQYCGACAPDVVLHVDHINPVSKGGDNDLLNLITSCEPCNNGKRARLIDDKSIIEKQRKMLEDLDNRREQLSMILQWRDELKKFDDELLMEVVNRVEDKVCSTVNDKGLSIIKGWLTKFELNELLQAIDDVREIYSKDGELDSEKMFSLIPKVAFFNRKGDDEKAVRYIRGILKNRISYVDERKALDWMMQAVECGIPTDDLKQIALDVRNWTQFRQVMEDLIDG